MQAQSDNRPLTLNAVSAGPLWRAAQTFVLIVALILVGNYLAGWIADALQVDVRPSNEDMVHRMIMIASAIYAVLIAIPFVPGVELGLAIIGMLGPAIVFLVYLSTLVGLTISYSIGRLIPAATLIALFDALHLHRAAKLLRAVEPLGPRERLEFLLARAPNRIVPFLLAHRYIALIVLINLPGNFLIGGGGGICMLAGFSRLYSAPAFLAAITVAVAPVPLAILLFGKMILPA